MTFLIRLYKNYIDGIIITLIFHILVFIILFFSQFRIKEKYAEPEIIIDFPEQIFENINPVVNNTDNPDEKSLSYRLKTNIASSKTASQQNKTFDDQYQKELEKAQDLINDVNKQLTREIPTINDLKMPEAAKANPNDIKDQLYSGESNMEYFLENRYHIKLPIPVYLAEGGGKVKVNIIVDRSGIVIKADPVIEISLSTQVLSYAKTAALRTRFNPDSDAPLQQAGYILYNFISQN